MRRFATLLAVVGAVSLAFLVGCGSSSDDRSALAKGNANSGRNADENPKPSPAVTVPKKNVADTGTASQPAARANDAGNIGVPQEGKPGSIRGKLKSPYVRLAQGVVFIVEVKGRDFPPPEKKPVMDQKNKMFTPHILPVQVSSTVDFPNTDDVRHSVYTRKGSANQFNLGQYDTGIVKHVKFEKSGVTHLGCNVHVEMSGFIVSCQNPFFTLASRKGDFFIDNVPPGLYQLTFFHEKIKEKTIEVTVAPGKETQVTFTGLKRKK